MKISTMGKACMIICMFLALVGSSMADNNGGSPLDINDVLKVLDKIKSSQDVSAVVNFKDVRDRYGIPQTVQILSPSGGEDVTVFVYNAKEYTSTRSTNIYSPDKIKHITSNVNLVRVFRLFYYEPFTIFDDAKHKNHYAIAILPSDTVKIIENKQTIQLRANLPIYIKSAKSILVISSNK